MKSISKILMLLLVLVVLIGADAAYLLFTGYFDHGKFEIKQTQWSSTHLAAIVAERSDNQALNSDEYSVLLGDHAYSPLGLRKQLHSDAPIFISTDECVSVHWQGPTTLLITCSGHEMAAMHVEYSKSEARGVTIIYEHIPRK